MSEDTHVVQPPLLVLKNVKLTVPEIPPAGSHSYRHVALSEFSKRPGGTTLEAQLLGVRDDDKAFFEPLQIKERELFMAVVNGDDVMSLFQDEIAHAVGVLRSYLLED